MISELTFISYFFIPALLFEKILHLTAEKVIVVIHELIPRKSAKKGRPPKDFLLDHAP